MVKVKNERSWTIFSIRPAARGMACTSKNLYNLYVYFWRWALWKVFEQGIDGPWRGQFSSAHLATWTATPFVGCVSRLRRQCGPRSGSLDLGGEGRGARQSENVFSIQTPVAIAVAFRVREAKTDAPARVHYTRVEGDAYREARCA